MAGGSENRTERPTPRKLQKAREKGQVARSREVPAAVVLLGGLLLISYSGTQFLELMGAQMKESLALRVPRDLTVSYLTSVLHHSVSRIGLAVGPLMAIALVLGIGANLLQGGFTLSWQGLGLHFEKLSPANGVSRVLSKNGAVELAKSLVTVFTISLICYQVISQYIPMYPRLVLMDVRGLLYWTAFIGWHILIRVGILLLVVAFADYAFQKYRFIEQLKMTKQEVKKELKDVEGDPLIKGRIRRIQREMGRRRMMAEVPNADVVITNPTHYAVALAYKPDSMEAPRVVAKGVGFLALKIRELAREHDVPTVENRVLAQTLYKTVEIGECIPAGLYKAVAEILAYIYKARNAFSR